MLRHIFPRLRKYGPPTPLKSILHHANLAVRYCLQLFYYVYAFRRIQIYVQVIQHS